MSKLNIVTFCESKKKMEKNENLSLLEKASLKSEIIANQARLKHVQAAADKDYQDFLRSLNSFQSSEDFSYNNQIIQSIMNMQNETNTEAIDVTMLVTGLHLAKTAKNDYETQIEKYRAETRALRQDSFG